MARDELIIRIRAKDEATRVARQTIKSLDQIGRSARGKSISKRAGQEAGRAFSEGFQQVIKKQPAIGSRSRQT